jgi:arylsulfatase A-like enzyme
MTDSVAARPNLATPAAADRPARRRRALGTSLVLLAGLALPGCRGCAPTPLEVSYDLCDRAIVSERWSSREVLIFGAPSSGPQLVDGFYREGGGGSQDPFLWAKPEAEVIVRWDLVRPRAAVVDVMPYRGVKTQSVEVLLNGASVTRFNLGEPRARHGFPLPAERQRVGENLLRFVFSGAASPAELDRANPDRRRLAAAFYSLTVGSADDRGLDDLLGRDAPLPFAVRREKDGPELSVVGPAALRYALRLPASAELRFTPDLHPQARAAAASAGFRVTIEDASRPGVERELWTRSLGPRDSAPSEVAVRLPGRPGDIVRIGLHVAAVASDRFVWATFKAPRVMGRGASDPLAPSPYSAAENAGADALRRSLAGANVILVVLDAARARQFGTYGYSRQTTPELDRIAREGVVFERAYTAAVYTLGAMPSIWTSQYPDRHHDDVSFAAALPKERLTLAAVLAQAGVHSAGFVANVVAGGLHGLDRGFSEFHEVWRTLGSRGDVFRKALAPWLAENRERRFFAYLHFREPHFPYNPEPPFDTKFGPDGPIPRAARGDMSFFTDVNQGRRPFSEAEREHLVRLYDGNLAFADQEVGAIRRELESQGLWDRTVFIVTGDHGEELLEHGWIGHNVNLFEESVHVPLIVRFPKGTGPVGVRVAGLVDSLDLAPTIADIVGALGVAGSDREFQGRSLLPMAMGAPGKPAVLSRTIWERPRYTLRDLRYTFFFDSRTGEERLFDRNADPGETRDVGASEPLRTAFFRQTLHQFVRHAGGAVRSGVESGGMTRDQCESLKSLGYLAADTACPAQ